MIDRKEVELLLRTNLGSSKQTIDGLTKSIGQFEKAIESQTAAAKKGESAIDELKASEAALVTISEQLKSKADLVGTFQRLATSIDKAEEKVTKTAAAYAKYNAKLGEGTERTDAQQKKMIALSLAHEKAQAALARQRDTQTAVTAALREAGVATENLAGAEQKIRSAVLSTAAALEKVRTGIKGYAADVRAAREAERVLADSDLAAKKVRDAAEFARASELMRKGDRALAVGQLNERDTKRDAGLAQQADDAVRATRGFNTLARAADDLTPKVVTLREAVNSIINPGAAARSTLGGVENQVKELGAAVDAIKGPVKNYNEQFKLLQETQKSLVSQAGLVDNFKRQAESLRAARVEFTTARAQVAQYADAVRQGGVAGEQFVKSLAEAKARAAAASIALRDQINVTRTSRDALRNAGIATNDLAAAEGRLATAARSTVGSITTLTGAVEKYGLATERSRKGGGIFGDEGRTTLSYVQRLRGEVLALASAYGGLQGSINLAKGALDSFNERSAAKSALAISVGQDKAAIDNEYDYVKGQAQRIGVEYEKLAKSYAKFSASAKLTGKDTQTTRYIFESFIETSRVLNLSTDDTNGILKALSDSFSKGTIQAEELTGQLGDRLPGAFAIAQEKLKGIFPDLKKALADGKVSADYLLDIAQGFRETVASGLSPAMKSLAAEQARMNNAVTDFKLAISDAGFADNFRKLIIELTTFLKSDDGKKFAEGFATKFNVVIEIFKVLLQNLDALTIAAVGFFAVWTAGKITGMVTDLRVLAAQAGTTAVALRSLAAVVMLVQAAFVGWTIGTIAYEKFEVVRQAGISLVVGIMKIWATIKHSFAAAFEALPIIGKNAFVSIVNGALDMAKKVTGIFAKIARAAGMDGVADQLEGAIKNAVGIASEQSIEGVIAARRKLLQAELKQITEDGFTAFEGVSDEMKKKVRSSTAGSIATEFPEGRPRKDAKAKDGDKEMKKRLTQIEQITRALEEIEARIDKSQKDSLSAQLNAIDTQYDALERKIKKLGGTEGAAFLKQLTDLTFQSKQQVMRKFNEDLAKEQEAIQKKLESVDAAAGRKSKFELDDRLKAISTSYEATYREIADFRTKLESNKLDTTPADLAKERLDAGIAELKQLEQVKYSKEVLQRLEQGLNDAIELREKRVKAVRAQEEVGAINDEEAAKRINQINADAVPSIQAAANATKEWAIANAAIFANPEQQQMFIAMMDTIALKAVQVKTEFTAIEQTALKAGQGAITSGLDQIVNSLGEVITGAKSAKQGLQDMGKGLLGIFAGFLKDIALAIIKLQIFNLMKQSGNPYLAAIGTAGAASVGVNHAGAVVGQVNNRKRTVPTAYFQNATRYHSGGLPGLSRDEVPAILERTEEVLSKDDPRNILNGGAAAGGQQQQSSNGTRFVLVDDRTKVAEAMASSEGENVILQTLRRNASTVKQYVNNG